MPTGDHPQPRRAGPLRRPPIPGLLWLLLSVPASATFGIDFTGSYSIFASATDNRGLESDLLQQQVTLDLAQRVAPFLTVRLGYHDFELESQTEQGADFSRRNREPRLEMLYARPRVSARLAFHHRQTEDDSALGDFESDALLASVSWQPRRGPGLDVTFRDESNVVDTGVFGRESDSRFLTVESYYNRDWGSLRYSFQRADLDSRSSGLDTRQDRQEVRAVVSRGFLDGHLTLDFSSSLSRVDRSTRLSDEPVLADPVPARQGLFAIDTSPEIGELEPEPGLIDGDVRSPTASAIDIGGANTFRNVGLELGVAAQVSRLEISVDTISSPGVLWNVFQSPDGLVWEPVSAVASRFDSALLRYTLNFPRATARYFKAVNVSRNQEPVVRVTEVRALVELTVATGIEELQSNFYRADLGARFRAGRISGRVNVGGSTDEDLAAGFVRRDYQEQHANAGLSFDLGARLQLNLGYRLSDLENRRDPVLLRTEEAYNASLRWSPLRTVDVVLSFQERDELEESLLLQSIRSTRLLATLGLLPDLRLTSDFQLVEIEDPLSGLTRDGWSWRESLSARPTRYWTLALSYSQSEFEIGGQPSPSNGDQAQPTAGLDTSEQPILERSDVQLLSTWTPTPFLVLTGTLSFGRDNERESIRQSLSVSYNPGPKLSLSATYQEFETRERSGTASDSVNLTYRLLDQVLLFGNLSRSRAEARGERTGEITSLRSGLRVFF